MGITTRTKIALLGLSTCDAFKPVELAAFSRKPSPKGRAPQRWGDHQSSSVSRMNTKGDGCAVVARWTDR